MYVCISVCIYLCIYLFIYPSLSLSLSSLHTALVDIHLSQVIIGIYMIVQNGIVNNRLAVDIIILKGENHP